jgi:hypothetical protein
MFSLDEDWDRVPVNTFREGKIGDFSVFRKVGRTIPKRKSSLQFSKKNQLFLLKQKRTLLNYKRINCCLNKKHYLASSSKKLNSIQGEKKWAKVLPENTSFCEQLMGRIVSLYLSETFCLNSFSLSRFLCKQN